MIDIIFSIISILLIISLYASPKGCLFLIFFYLIFPESVIAIGSSQITKNYILILCYLSFYLNYKNKNKKIYIAPFRHLLIYFGLLLIIIPFQNGLNHIYILKYWLQDIILALAIPVIVYNYINNIKRQNLSKVKNTLIIVIIISTIYGLILTLLNGENPYIQLFSSLYYDPDAIVALMRYYADPNRIFGRISSVFFHPMLYALFLGFSLIYTIYIKDTIKKNLFYSIILILFLNIFFCGVRTVIAALFLTLIYYLYRIRKIKIVLYTLFILCGSYFILSYIPGMSDYINSINVGSNDNDVGGSSVDMRILQLLGSIEETKNSLLQGKGYGWHKYYLDTQGDHPIIFNFESLVFITICNSGVIGFVVWFIFIFNYYSYCHKLNYSKTKTIIIECLLIYYLAYSCITGEYNYMGIFMTFYAVMIGESIYKTKKQKLESIYVQHYNHNSKNNL